jgi:hypothetical protein
MRHHPPKNTAVVLSRYILVFVLSLLSLMANRVDADVPRVPFAGVYGATVGGGSLTGWQRLGGENPAVMAGPGYGASLSGYTPLGLDDLRVTEVALSRDGTRFGVSLGWRNLADQAGVDESRFRMQAAWRTSKALSIGGFISSHVAESQRSESEDVGYDGGGVLNAGWGGGLGVLARPSRGLSLGVAGESVPTDLGRVARIGIGADFGTSLPTVIGRGAAWRGSAECFQHFGFAASVAPYEWRFAFGLRPHSSFGVYAGYAPQRETAALGVAFGVTDFEGFSAVRRHSALGGTAVQGLGWVRRPYESK